MYGAPAPSSAAKGDFNGDGTADLALGNTGLGLSVSLGNGQGGFGASTSISIPGSYAIISVGTGDFNADGKLDLVAVNFTTGVSSVNFYVLLGQGNGTFFTPVSYSAGNLSQATGLAIADLNGDGKLDLAITGFGSAQVSALFGTGTGTFGAPSLYATGSGPISVATGDLNGDAKPELVVANDGSNSVTIRFNDGAGAFPSSYSVGTGFHPDEVKLADFNNDSKLDMVVRDFGSGNEGDVKVLLGDGTGLFPTSRTLTLYSGPPDFNPFNPTTVTATDLNLDGKLDVVVGEFQGLIVSFSGDSAGNFTVGQKILTPQQPNSLLPGDINGDGRPDLVYLRAGAAIVVLLRRPDQSLPGSPPFFDVGGYVIQKVDSIGLADFNGDAKTDYAVIREGQGFSVGLGNGAGSFGQPTLHSASYPQAIAAGEFTGDGKVDVATLNYYGTLSIFPGDGAGNFGAQIDSSLITAQGGLFSLVAGDFNQDGKLDVAGSNGSISASVAFAALGDGAGHFGAPSTYPLSGPVQVVAADLNGDGKLDLAAAITGDPSASAAVLIGNGMGGFGAPLLFPVRNRSEGGVYSVAAGDMNGDGKNDLIFSFLSGISGIYGSISILYNNGTGFFSAGPNLPLFGYGSLAFTVRTADVNGDGKKDILAADGAGAMWAYLSDGTGGFTAGSFLVAGYPRDMVVGDLNGDGKSDAVVTNYGYYMSNGISVLLNTCVPPPTVTGVVPPTGTSAGGTAVTITGTGFVSGAIVTIGGIAATNVTVSNSTTITATTGPHPAGSVAVVVTNPDNQSATLGAGFTYLPSPLSFYTLTPCRIIDTRRQPPGEWGGPSLVADATRVFTIAGQCIVPSTAKSVSVNVTVTQGTGGLGYLILFPGGTTPGSSTINFRAGQTRANNAIAPLSATGTLSVTNGPGTTHFILDVNGYFQ